MRYPKRSEYPKRLYITNEVYKVKLVKKMPKKTFGDTDPGSKTIRIKATLGLKNTLSTFIHEVLHALAFEHEIKIRHKAIHKLEKALIELLEDNT